MLYLLRSFKRGGSILKIGYAGDVDYRISQYRNHNPGIEVIGTREGELIDEARMHLYFQSFGYGSCMNEWYEDREEIINGFRELTIEDLNTRLWEVRDNVFKFSVAFYSRSSYAFKIYSSLFNINYKKEDSESYDKNKILCENKKVDLGYLRFLEDLEISKKIEELKSSEENAELIEHINEFNSYGQFTDKMRVLCKHPEILGVVHYDYSNYYYALGPDRIKACEYKKCLLEEELEKIYSVQNNVESLCDVIYSTFNIGYKYTRVDIKLKFKEIYDKLDVKITPNSLTIKDYFEVKEIQITNKETGKRDKGFLILNKKKGE